MGKKKYKKGIESLEKEIEFHKEKLKNARDKQNIELEGYYVREIERIESQIEASP